MCKEGVRLALIVPALTNSLLPVVSEKHGERFTRRVCGGSRSACVGEIIFAGCMCKEGVRVALIVPALTNSFCRLNTIHYYNRRNHEEKQENIQHKN